MPIPEDTSLPVGRGKRITNKPCSEAIARGQVRSDLLNRYVPIVTGCPVAGTSEYAAWVRDAFQMRNEIVHEGRRSISDVQVGAAFTAVVEFISSLEDSLGSP